MLPPPGSSRFPADPFASCPMIDPVTRLSMERDVSLLADPEIDIAIGTQEGRWMMLVVRRKNRHLTDPMFRFRDPDRA